MGKFFLTLDGLQECTQVGMATQADCMGRAGGLDTDRMGSHPF
eukprot:NODE_9644_length_204_cov_20.729032_g9561_i0.p4 GENE.NODE_9644_length_204_cov_20.729032_g9561_i0~~NODE_9644_length_204_cov_20.729032_g9561_i0.p4  ORF type:complete len:50 (-),score=18.87 NODE_9644_length_204_cov_20.729032_g9561_i0:54-182(-)